MMLLYLGGLAKNETLLDRLRHVNILTNYLERWTPGPERRGLLFLDSGAFTAFSSGRPIALEQYIAYCLEHRQDYDVIAALDVIGDAGASQENYRQMSAAGLDILPAYHLGEDWAYYEWLLAHYAYVAIGGLAWRVSSGTRQVRPVHRALCRAHRWAQEAGVKLHGFGITDWQYMRGYPWRSVDSTTYLVGARFGHVMTYTPREGLGQRLRPNERGRTKERMRLQRYLENCPFAQPYGTDDLLPLQDTPDAAMNRLHFNCLAMQHAVAQLP